MVFIYTGMDVTSPDKTEKLNNLFELETGRNYATFFSSDTLYDGLEKVTSDHSLNLFFKVLNKYGYDSNLYLFFNYFLFDVFFFKPAIFLMNFNTCFLFNDLLLNMLYEI